MSELSKLGVGDIAFLKMSCDSRRKPYAVTITKATKTHLHVARQRFLIESGIETGSNWTPDRLYATLREYETEKRIAAKLQQFKRHVERISESDLSEDELDDLLARLERRPAADTEEKA